MARIYISSTYEDLVECRKAVDDTLRKLNHEVICMENYVATDRRPLDKCLSDIDSCDIYVGIFAWRYGYVPPHDNPKRKSITELEFRHASNPKNPKTCLIFLLAKDVSWPVNYVDGGEDRKRIELLRNKLSERGIVSFFHDRNELAREVSVAVTRALAAPPTPPPPSPGPPKGDPLRPLRSEALAPIFIGMWRKYRALTLLGRCVVAGLLMAATLLVSEAIFLSLPIGSQENVKIKLGLLPEPIVIGAPDWFDLTGNGEPIERHWDYPKGGWRIIHDDTSTEEHSGVLQISSDSWGVRNDLGRGKAFYDFSMCFRVKFTAGNKAGWVLRAQEDKKSGYVFELEKRGSELFLNGWVYANNGNFPMGNTPDNRLRLSGPFYAEDYFEITAAAKDYQFTHTLVIKSSKVINEKMEVRDNLSKQYQAPLFKDQNESFRFGNVGFFAPNGNGPVLVDNYEFNCKKD